MAIFFGEVRELTKEEVAAQQQFEARIRRDADPRILRRADRWLQPRMLPSRELPQALRTVRTHFDDVLHDWHVGYLSVNEGGEAPYELRQDLAQCVPQAILRDIYRPVHRPSFVEKTLHEGVRDPVGQEALAEMKKSLQRDPVPEVDSTVVAMVREQRRRRRLLGRRWLPYRADDEPRFHTPQSMPFGEIWSDDADGAEDVSSEQIAARQAFLQKWKFDSESSSQSESQSEDDE